MRNQLLVGLCCIAVSSLVNANEDLLRSVAQVRVTGYEVEFDNPWQKGSGSQYSGSAVLIDDDRMITNAHVISLPLRIEVKRGDSNRWYKAVVENVSDASDLALLVVEDKGFYKGSKPVAIGNDLALGSDVTVVGFPIGGDSMSITEGILSRTEVTSYVHSGRDNLTYQLDAAINSGNSGGPVFHDGKLVAISSQAIEEADSIGYAIPVPVINQFLTDVKDGNVDGVPILPFRAQPIFNATQRDFFGMGDRNGLRLTQSAGPEDTRCLADGDIILSVEGFPIGPDGMIRVGTLGSVPIDYLASSKQVGDSLDFELVAKGKNRSVSCELNWTWNDVFSVTPTTYKYRPVWAQVGGIVLVEMTYELFEFLYINEMTLQEGVSDAEAELQQGTPQDPRRYLFVVNVLQHDLNEGYDVTGLLLSTVNGIALRNITHLQQFLDSNSLAWVELGFNNGESVVFRAADLPALDEQLAQEYGF
jgi:S1-C subfamily serine protease